MSITTVLYIAVPLLVNPTLARYNPSVLARAERRDWSDARL